MHAQGAHDRLRANRLLAQLPATALHRLAASGQIVEEAPGAQVERVNHAMERVYFPLDAVYSILARGEDGDSVEAATVGNEGFVGEAVFLDLGLSPFCTVLQIPGRALRVPAPAFRSALADPCLHELVRGFVGFSLWYARQTTLCNVRHRVEARAARWLLMTADRAQSDDLPLTHEMLAVMLGVRRQTVSLIAGAFQRAGAIRYRRGRVRILDRALLAASSCECYRASLRFYESLVLRRDGVGRVCA